MILGSMPIPVAAAPALPPEIGAINNASTGGSSLGISTPACAVGDFLIFAAISENDTVPPATPSGFTQISSYSFSGSSWKLAVRTVTGSEQASYTVSLGSTNGGSGVLFVVTKAATLTVDGSFPYNPTTLNTRSTTVSNGASDPQLAIGISGADISGYGASGSEVNMTQVFLQTQSSGRYMQLFTGIIPGDTTNLALEFGSDNHGPGEYFNSLLFASPVV